MAWQIDNRAGNFHSELHIGPFELQAGRQAGMFNWDILMDTPSGVAVLCSGDATAETLEEAQEQALNKLNEIIVEARGAIDHHLERAWKKEAGHAHLGA